SNYATKPITQKKNKMTNNPYFNQSFTTPGKTYSTNPANSVQSTVLSNKGKQTFHHSQYGLNRNIITRITTANKKQDVNKRNLDKERSDSHPNSNQNKKENIKENQKDDKNTE